ncbi:MAG TPA: aldo/keto reductase [Chthoniobacteraceae bacterium]|jgi:diketogulonate reductase-like aldo/keto reductase
MNTIQFTDGTNVPVLGQGTWKFGEGERDETEEVAALRTGVELGMTLIDTAEMYGNGAAEKIVGRAIEGLRDRVFLVTKAYPHHASRRELPRACERSLQRLGTDVIDLYLLHWRGQTPLAETVEAFEALRTSGKIRRWGVSNFDIDDMKELGAMADDCATNQVLYNPEARGIEFALLSWCRERQMPVMAYSPVGQAGRLLKNKALLEVARLHDATPAQIAIAWALRQPGVIAIPKASNLDHLRENAAAASIKLTVDDLAAIDAAFAPPDKKRPLEML